MPVPPNVSSLLASRLDRLLPLERSIVERAAVIGFEFQPAALSALAPEGDAGTDLAPPLSALCDKRLIRPTPRGFDDKGYHFSHLLLRDAAYDRCSSDHGRACMSASPIGSLEISGDRVAEVEEIIGYHLEQSFRYRAELGPVDVQARALGDRAARHLGAPVRGRSTGGHARCRDLAATRCWPARAGTPGPAAPVARGRRSADRCQGELAAAEATLEQARQAAALIGNELIGGAAELARLQLRYVTDATIGRAPSCRARAGTIPVLEEAGDNHGLARAWRLMTYVHWTASRFGIAAQAAESTIRHAATGGRRPVGEAVRRHAGAFGAVRADSCR